MKVFGAVVLFLSISTALSIRPFWHPWNGAFSAGGVVGILIADSLLSSLNVMGTVLFTGICLILSLYLISRFSMAAFMAFAARWLAGPLSFLAQFYGWLYARFVAWREAKDGNRRRNAPNSARLSVPPDATPAPQPFEPPAPAIPVVDPLEPQQAYSAAPVEEPEPPIHHDIPIHELEYQPPPASVAPALGRTGTGARA